MRLAVMKATFNCMMPRRRFFGTLARSSAAFATAGLIGRARRVTAALPPLFSGGVLTAAPASLEIWRGFSTRVLAFNGSMPGPTIRVRRGSFFEARVVNQLSEPLVVHWHGLLTPARMDGHPADAVPPGGSDLVSFPVTQRAGTYWYHAHTDGRTGRQAYLGLAGAFIVDDPSEATLNLPTGDYDVPVLLTDKRPDSAGQLPYSPSMFDVMNGFLGTEILANGQSAMAIAVDRSLYRLRLINASNARILKIGFSDNRTFHLIANDAGLLSAPVAITSVFLPPGARGEILVNFSANPIGLIQAGEVPFQIVSPQRTASGNNLLVLRGGEGFAKSLPQRIEIPNLAVHATRLHFLGAVGGWAWPFGGEPYKDLPVAKVTVHFQDGATQELVFRNGVEFADWISPAHEVPGSKLVPDLVRHGQVRWFSSQLPQPGLIKQIIIESFDNRVAPTFVAITAES